ncbi:MAG: hypothetical protein H7641_08825 [Candidatus Heimdallarchaeota archaeon]|nr:hypothetical protein [Candidatus Heimdallarchaeota archaeon]MCK4877669.1 hypothetical protein [Candidatus Heimdallarchaeota archaeon]
MLDYYILDMLTVLRKSPYWNGIGKIDGRTDMEPFVETLNLREIGDYSSNIAEFKAGKLDIVSLTAKQLK